MSAFALPVEHLQVLVSAGHRLGVSQIVLGDRSILQFDLGTFEGRSMLLDVLRSENRSAIGQHTPNSVCFFGTGNPQELWPNPSIDLPRDAAQIIQWIRCYEYQSRGSATWMGSVAQRFCAVLTIRLLDRISQMFGLSWTFDPLGDTAVEAHQLGRVEQT
jgi:hypothetical protein